MDNITSAINLLGAVLSTMDEIAVVGVSNQNKFVGCAEAIQTVSQTLTKFLSDAQVKPTVEEKEEVNG